ncbi:MAG: phasin family protein [Candidatus Abyssubacteria bacterium]|nr:phasin family protein [Candidatus Abyssubacteria bacterium]
MTRTIRRYANRKLYDTESSHYVSLHDILKLVRAGEDIEVVDSRTGEDLTSVTLAQDMAEEEKSEGSTLPLDVLKELIKRGSESLDEIMRVSRLAGKGAVQMAEESTSKYFEKLVDRGEMDEDEAKGYLKMLSKAVTKRRRSLEGKIDERVETYVVALDLPSRKDIARVAKKIDSIIEKLDAHISKSRTRKQRARKKK